MSSKRFFEREVIVNASTLVVKLPLNLRQFIALIGCFSRGESCGVDTLEFLVCNQFLNASQLMLKLTPKLF